MAYREKIAWLTLVSMAIAYTLYFSLLLSWISPDSVEGPPVLQGLMLFGAITLVQAVVVAIGSAVLSIRARARGESKPDERDRAIERRGATAGYYVLLAGMILVGVIMPFSDPRWKITNAALLAIVVAETVRLVLVILGYRRGWHG